MESIEKVRKILERFYQGETSLDEERWLQDYFSSQAVPEELEADQELFRAFNGREESITVPQDLDSKILSSIDKAEGKLNRNRRISLYSFSGLAAGILALVAVYVFFLRTDEPDLMSDQQGIDTYADPIDAYVEAKKTLAFVSGKLNSGTNEMRHVQQITKTTAEPLQSLSKISKGSRELVLLGELQRVREIDN